MPIQSTIQKSRVQWILNALRSVEPASIGSSHLVSWVYDSQDDLGITLPSRFTLHEPKAKKDAEDKGERTVSASRRKVRINRYNVMTGFLGRALKESENRTLKQTSLEINLSSLADRINLPADDRKILLFYIDFLRNSFDYVVGALRHRGQGDDYYQKLSKVIGVPEGYLSERLSSQSALRNFIVYDNIRPGWQERGFDFTNDTAFQADRTFVMALQEPSASADQILARLIGPAPATSLTIEDFAFMGGKLTNFIEALRGVVDSNGHTRKNASLIGQPGVGKTELVAAIGKHLGISVYLIGLSHLTDNNPLADSQKEPTREDRLMSWRRARYLAEATGMKCLFLFDEADDILRNPKEEKSVGGAPSKAFLNHLLDSNTIPTVFVSNNVDTFEESSVRRILPSLLVPQPPLQIRSRIAFNYGEKYGIPITRDQADNLGKRYPDLTPGVIESIFYYTSKRKDFSGPDRQSRLMEAIEFGFSEAETALNGGAPVISLRDVEPSAYYPDLIAASANLPHLVDQFSRSASLRGLSLCLVGQDGAGKKSFFHHMAGKLGLPLRPVSFPALYGPMGFNVDEMANELHQAELDKALLIFGNISPLLKENASGIENHPLFKIMATHPLPVAATLPDYQESDRIDMARLLGRFTFSVRMYPLDREKSAGAISRLFNVSAGISSQAASRISEQNLVIGDFVRAARQMSFMPDTPKTAETIAATIKALRAAESPQEKCSVGYR